MGLYFSMKDGGGRERVFEVSFGYRFDEFYRLPSGKVAKRDLTFAFVREHFENAGSTQYTGVAVRNPIDAFTKQLGRHAALENIAYEQLGLNPEEAIVFLGAYYDAKNNARLASTGYSL